MKAHRWLVITCAAALATACQKAPVGPVGEDLPALEADRVMYGVDFFSNSDGVKRARTHADTAYAFNNPDSASLHLRVLRVEIYDESGGRVGTVTAKSGVIDSRTKAMVARGNVVLIMNKDGKRVETQELHYDPNSHRVWSNVPSVIVERDGSRRTTETFETDDKFRNFRATGARGATGIKF